MNDKKVPVNIYKVSSPFTAKVVENVKITRDPSPNDTHHVVVDLSGSQYEYLEGQSAGVLTPGADQKGKPHAVRLYSIASSRKGEKKYSQSLSFCVKRVLYQDPATGEERRGIASNYVCGLKPGDPIRLTGPAGNRFLLPEDFLKFNYVFIATGTGIAPYRGMLSYLFENHFQGEIWLIFGVPYRTDLLYEGEFRSYVSRPNFHFVTAVSREEKLEDGSKVYVQHRLLENQDRLIPLMLQANMRMYMCGLKGMEKGIDESLKVMFNEDQYHQVKSKTLVEVY